MFVLVLGAYAGLTESGRRSGLACYLQGASFVLAMFVFGVLSMGWESGIGFEIIDFLVLTGFYMKGGPDAPIVITGFIWWLSILLLVLLAFLFGRLAKMAFSDRANGT